MIAVSIVSHGHGDMVGRLIGQLLAFPEVAQIILTLNVPESVALPDDARLTVIGNAMPKGFGANHNAAFTCCTQTFFCPLNPDIEFDRNPFPVLSAALANDRVALVAPLVRSPDGKIEDSIRHFPTPASLLMKALGGSDGRYAVSEDQADFAPEWVAGMFMLFRSRDFHDLGEFDERFFLYYEDVDICVRVWQNGMRIQACPKAGVIHDARRGSRRSLRHLCWHLGSMARFLWKHRGRLPKVVGDKR
ncbi:MAG TPA: glycosyltransferase [Accumulibacter sp.]|nr:glycosyltransferase [Accumulibacter sp.]